MTVLIRDERILAPPADYAEILQRWEAYNIARTLTALAAFVLVISLTTRTTSFVRPMTSEREDAKTTWMGDTFALVKADDISRLP
ncbi:hypothetical protein ALI22I_11455 [Saccharothrix sp. ALI-22-I]|uniref:hypothetical protein n=1 Tax=Saccharothrix sp. ALI-22-I TaxID=1933778 RepID=UPI00097C5276|nr:hypothetical protein [Saccharothrix sp. ALI-22-I]ONI90715.1 hypothetical protein ALI22I_11455 [Saccharothrix sp. ALI-22-I]